GEGGDCVSPSDSLQGIGCWCWEWGGLGRIDRIENPAKLAGAQEAPPEGGLRGLSLQGGDHAASGWIGRRAESQGDGPECELEQAAALWTCIIVVPLAL